MSMMDIGAWPKVARNRGRNPATREMLKACRELEARGEAITRPKVARMIRRSLKATQGLILRAKQGGEFPHRIEPVPIQSPRTDRIIAAAETIEARGERVSYELLSIATGMSRNNVHDAVKRAKLDPRWRWDLSRRKPPGRRESIMERLERNRRSGEASRASLARPEAELRAMVSRRKAEFRAEFRAAMIDASREIDEPPHGVAPRSNKDHSPSPIPGMIRDAKDRRSRWRQLAGKGPEEFANDKAYGFRSAVPNEACRDDQRRTWEERQARMEATR